MIDVEWLMTIFNSLVIKYGYIGAFALATISNMILFLPVPYLVTFFLLGESPQANIILLSLAGGIGAAMGKLLSYFVGFGGSKVIGEGRRKRIFALRKLLRKYGALIILIVAATPMPDDIFLIPFGMMRYDITKYFAACAIGKTILTFMVMSLGRLHYMVVTTTNLETSILISVIGFIIVSAVIFGVNWEEVLNVIEEKGLKEGLKNMTLQVLSSLSYSRMKKWVERHVRGKQE